MIRHARRLTPTGVQSRTGIPAYVLRDIEAGDLPPTVVGPGSARSVGRRWRYYRIIDPTPPAALPDGIASQLRPPALAPVPWSPRPQHSRYGHAAVTGECGLIRAAHPGTRNTVLFRAAVRLGTLVGADVLDEQDVHRELRAAASVHNGVDGFTAGEAERAIANGLRYGQARPGSSGCPEDSGSRTVRCQQVARRSADRAGASGDEPATTRPGGTGLAALGHYVIPPGRATPEPPPSLWDPDPAR